MLALASVGMGMDVQKGTDNLSGCYTQTRTEKCGIHRFPLH